PQQLAHDLRRSRECRINLPLILTAGLGNFRLPAARSAHQLRHRAYQFPGLNALHQSRRHARDYCHLAFGCADPSTTTPSPNFPFRLSTSVRNCPLSSPSARCVNTFTPFTSTARAMASSSSPAADFIRISSISRRRRFSSSSCAANFAFNPSVKFSTEGTYCPATCASSKSRRNVSSDPIPLIASILRTPEETDSSPVSLNRPISPVAA